MQQPKGSVEALPSRPAWRTPRLQALGNLRDFVRVGNALGKSGIDTDGHSAAGPETMTHMN